MSEREETPAEEFSRLVIEYNEPDTDGTRAEAWNLIADFALEHCDTILRALRAPSPSPDPAQVTDAMVEAAQKVLERRVYDEGGVIGEEVTGMVREMLTAAIGAGGQAVAWRISCPDDEIYGCGPDTLRFHPLSPDEIAYGYTQQPLFTHPADERVVEALATMRIDRDNEAERKVRARHDKDTTMVAVHAYAEGVLAGHVKSFEAALAHPVQPGWREPDGFTPYLWQCKDYADGWISYADKEEALAYQRDTGCLLRITYRPAAPQPKGA